MSDKGLTATALRRKFHEALELIAKGQTVPVTKHGKVIAALIPGKDYEQFLQFKAFKAMVEATQAQHAEQAAELNKKPEPPPEPPKEPTLTPQAEKLLEDILGEKPKQGLLTGLDI